MKVEYKVREIKRYVVTRYAESGKLSSSEMRGEFTHPHSAQLAARAFGRMEALDRKDTAEVLYPDPPENSEDVAESA